MGKVGHKQRKQDTPFHFKCIVQDNERMGMKKTTNFKRAKWLPINDPDIIPDKLKSDLSKRIRNAPKTRTIPEAMIYVANSYISLNTI